MKILKIDGYLDGGTLKIVTQDEIYFIDYRIRSKNKGVIYIGYPSDKDSYIVDNQKEITKQLKYSLDEYESDDLKFDWKPAVYERLGIENKYEIPCIETNNLTDYQLEIRTILRNKYTNLDIEIGRGDRLLVDGHIIKGVIIYNQHKNMTIEIDIKFYCQEIQIQYLDKLK